LILLEISELEDSIESNPNFLSNAEEHSDLISASEDFPTPPFRHPSEEGISPPRLSGTPPRRGFTCGV